MKITRIEALPLWSSFADAMGGADNVPTELAHPAFGYKSTPLQGQGAVVVRVHTDEGIVGVGETMGRPGPRGAAAYTEDVLGPMLVGQDPLQLEAHWEAMHEECRFAPIIVSGVDSALWDIRGQVYGEPVYRLLGGPRRDDIACYASPIPFLPTPDASAAYAQTFLNDGFLAIKLKIGRGVADDLDHVAAVRAAIGPSIKLLVDCNGAYTIAESVELAKGLIREDVFWLEEPVQPEFVADLAALRRRVDLPIATGEWLATVHQFHDLLRAGAADVLMPNITRCGGITGFRRIAELAAAHNVVIAPHGVGAGVGIQTALQAITAIPNFLIYEYNQLFNPLRHAVLAEPIDYRAGWLRAAHRPGIGVVLDETALRQYDLNQPVL